MKVIIKNERVLPLHGNSFYILNGLGVFLSTEQVYDLSKVTAKQLTGLLKNCLVKPEPKKSTEWITPTGYLTDYKVGAKVKFSNGNIAEVREVPKFGTDVFHCTIGWCRFDNVIAIEKL